MSEEKRIKEAIQKAGSVEALIERAAPAEAEALKAARRRIEKGPYHPTEDLLQDFALGTLDSEDTLTISEHLDLCESCSDKVFKIQYDEALRAHENQARFLDGSDHGFGLRLLFASIRPSCSGY